MIIATTFLIGMFLLYNYLIFVIMDTFLENPRFKKIYRIPVCIINTIIFTFFLLLNGGIFFIEYLIIGFFLFAELVIFYKDKLLRSLFCSLACMIHIMAIRSFCVAGFSIATQRTFYDIASNNLSLILSTIATFVFLNIAVVLVIKFVPAKDVRIINQHDDQLWFMTGWLSVFYVYLLINSKVYTTPDDHITLLYNQITAPIAILIGTYILLFFSFKMASLLGYKEKNEELQDAVEKERQYRTSLDKGVFRIIEANFTKNEIISGFEDYEEQFGDVIHNYTEMLTFMIQSEVHPEDKGKFLKYSSHLAIVGEFEQGKREVIFDYRRLMPEGAYLWMQFFMPFMKDEKTGDVRGFIQIKDIDEEKKQQLELQYKAERDLLTGLYNKVTTEKLICEYLDAYEGHTISGALFVIDIDNFKTINDRLGHLYGDAVLSELAESLDVIFRENDIVGRIGGDEFLVFAKGPISQGIIIEKANNICRAFLRTYANEENIDYTVSSSIGIAIIPKDGTSFEDLFKCADSSLYLTKAKGKNGYSFYEKESQLPYVSNRTEIYTNGVIQKRFKDNRIEYVFRLLYGSEDTKLAIESVLELIAKNFEFSRANIFQFNESSTMFNNIFEWCAVGINSVSKNYINIPLSDFDFIVSALEKSGGMFMAEPADFPIYAQESYNAIDIKSIVHFSIKERDQLIGVIAFQNCTNENLKISEAEFNELRTICQVLSVFMAKQLSSERENHHHQAIEAVMENMESIAYVIDRENYEVFYENQNVVNITGCSSIGTKCYRSYRGLDAPCGDCALNYVSEENPRCTLDLYTEKFDLYTRTSGALIDWAGDKKALLISSVDVSEYKRDK